MTLESMFSLYRLLIFVQVVVVMVTVGIAVRRMTTRNVYRSRGWYADTWMCPGIYRIYGDGNPFRTGPKRVLGYLMAFIVIYMTYGFVGGLVGMLALRDLQRIAILRDLATEPLTGGFLIVYSLPVVIGLLHIICIPEEWGFKVMRTVLPVVSALLLAVVLMLGGVVVEQRIVRFTYRLCEVFPGNPVCEFIY